MARTKRKINPVQQTVPVPDIPKRHIYQTGGYVRLSVEDSGNPGADTIEAQKALVQAFIEAQPDMQFCRLYCDNGCTGTNFERPAFETLMSDVRTGKIDCIVVKDLSRFGRNYLETGNYLERIFPYLGVRFVAVNDNFDTLTAERSSSGYIVPLKNIINAAYSKDISRKSSSALRMKQQNGEFIGSFAPYGYKKCADDHHRIEPDEETAPVVRRIFEWRCSGMSYRAITIRLNERGIPSPSKRRYLKGELKSKQFENVAWRIPAVRRILLSETYLGHLVQGRCRNNLDNGKKRVYLPKEEWTIVRNTHEALIDEQAFLVAAQMDEENQKTFQERKGRYDYLGYTPNLFLGLIFCADCKHPMSRTRVTRYGKKLSYDFRCLSHQMNTANCSFKQLNEEDLKEVVWDTIQREISLAGDVEKLIQQYRRSEKFIRQNTAIEREIAAAMQAENRAKKLFDSLYQNYADKLMTEKEYTELKQMYRADIECAKARLAELEQRKQEERNQTNGNAWLTVCRQFQGETELSEEITHAFIERIEVDSEKHISITLRYRDEYLALTELLKTEGLVVLT